MTRPRLRRLAAGLALSALVLVAIEGVSSGLYFAWEVWTGFELPIQERHHTRYDAELGWVNVPDLQDPDMYAPGRGFTSNAQGFRNRHDIAIESPEAALQLAFTPNDERTGQRSTLYVGVQRWKKRARKSSDSPSAP